MVNEEQLTSRMSSVGLLPHKSGPSVFVGIINKINADEMKVIGARLLRNIPNESFVAKDRGFCIYFAAAKEAHDAAELLEDLHLDQAVGRRISARVHNEEENGGVTATIDRMERELWIHSVYYQDLYDDVERFSDFLTRVKLMKPTDVEIGLNGATVEQEAEARCAIMLQFGDSLSVNIKFVIPMISSEAAFAVASAEFRIPDQFKFTSDAPRFSVSRACFHKHRFDVSSVYLHLPNGRTIWDLNLYMDWSKDFGLDKFQRKVKNEKAYQIWNESFNDSRCLDYVKQHVATSYRGVEVTVVPWEEMVLYNYALKFVSEETRTQIVRAIEGPPHKEPEPVSPAPVVSTVAGNQNDDDENVQFYFDLSILEESLYIQVFRTVFDEPATLPFYDLFVFTTGTLLPAYKRADNLRRLEPQMYTAEDRYRAQGCMLLNHSVSKDSLGALVFYFWFGSKVEMKVLMDDIKTKRFTIKDIIQQTAGNSMATDFSVGDGFSGEFPAGVDWLDLDLVEIAADIRHRKYNS